VGNLPPWAGSSSSSGSRSGGLGCFASNSFVAATVIANPAFGQLAIRFGVILRKVWGGSRTWAGAKAQSVLMSVCRTCWQQGRSALDFLSQLVRGMPMSLSLPP
jgi:transposase